MMEILQTVRIAPVLVGLAVILMVIQSSEANQGYKRRRILFASCSEETVKPKVLFMKCANSRGSCELRRGSTHSLRAVFKPTINSTKVESYVVWNTGFLNIPLPNQEYDACKDAIRCPVIANTVARFTYHLPIADFWPSDEFPVMWTLSDADSGEEILCFRFRISIR